MKLNAVGVTTSDFKKTITFYTILGFKFNKHNEGDDHLDSIPEEGSIRLMIDTKSLVEEIIGEEPMHGNHSAFALEYDSPEEINEIVQKLKSEGFTVVKEPWDAFWGQRYAIVADPDGYKVDLYAAL